MYRCDGYRLLVPSAVLEHTRARVFNYVCSGVGGGRRGRVDGGFSSVARTHSLRLRCSPAPHEVTTDGGCDWCSCWLHAADERRTAIAHERCRGARAQTRRRADNVARQTILPLVRVRAARRMRDFGGEYVACGRVCVSTSACVPREAGASVSARSNANNRQRSYERGGWVVVCTIIRPGGCCE